MAVNFLKFEIVMKENNFVLLSFWRKMPFRNYFFATINDLTF